MKKILSVALALIMIVSCCTLMVFAGGPYTVTVSVDGTGGKFIDATGKTAFVPLTTTASDSAVPEGSEKIYVIAPDAGYRVKSVKVNGQEAALDHLTLKLSNISGNKDIVIQFETGTKTDQTVVNETFDTGIDNFTSTGTGNISWDETDKALKVSGASTNFRLIYSPGMEVKTGHKYTITFDITPSITQQNCGAFGIDAGDKGYTFDTLRSSNATNILYNYTNVGTFNNSYTANTKTTFTYDFTVFGIKNNGVQVDSVDTKTIGANVLFINMIKTAGITGFEATIDNFKIVDTSVTAGPPADPTLSISVDGGNGTVKDSGAVVSGDVTVPYGGSKTLTFVPDNGYLIDKVLVNGAPVTLDSKNEYTLTNITENQSIVASFKQKPLNGPYTVSASVNGSGGKVSDVTGKPSGYVPMATSLVNEEVEHGSSRTYIIAPDIGYSIKSIEVNGTVVRPDHYTLTVPNIIKDTDIIITFEQQATAEDVVVNETFETGIEGFVRSAGNGVIAWDKTNKALSITNASTNTRFAYTPGLEMKAGHKYTVSFDITTNKAGSGQFGLEASSSTAYYKFDTINAAKPAQLLYNHNATGYKAYTYTPNTKTTFSFDFYFLGIKNGEIQLDSMHSRDLGANNLYFNLVKEEGITGFEATIDNFKIVDQYTTLGPKAPEANNVEVVGNPMEGQTLTASYDFFDANVGDEEDEQATEIKWYAASGSSPANWGTAIGTGKTYTLTSNEVGKYIKAEVTPYSKAEPKKGTPASSPVYGPVLAAQALPSVSNVLLTGEAKVGSTLTVGYTFTPTGGEGNSTYEWYVSDSAEGTYTLIQNEKNKSYLVAAANAGKYIKCKVTPVGSNGLTGAPVDSAAQLISTEIDSYNLYVALDGDDANAGTLQAPFKTLEKARDTIRTLKTGGMSNVAFTVNIKGGVYDFTSTFALTDQDSGSSESCPVTYQAYNGEEVVFRGGKVLDSSKIAPVSDQSVLDRIIDSNAKKMVRQLDLKEQGINSIEEIPRYGFGIVPPGGDYKPSDIYFNHSALIKARYPNKVSGSEFVKIGAVIAGGDRVSNTPFTIKYTDDRPALWDLSKAKDIYVSGFFGNDFADSVTRVASIDTKEKTLTSVDGPTYPALADHKYFYFNLIEEIDLPGESYIDRDTMMLYFYPADDVDTCIMEIATFDKPFVTMTGASNITLKGINFDLSRDSAVNMTNSKNCVVDDAQISRLSYNAINIKAGTDCKVVNSHMFDLGCGAITVSGGDQITLTPGNNLFENNLFHRVNRVYASYRPAIVASGVGQKIINNEFYDSPHMVIKLEGNDMLIQYNKIHDVVREAADMAAIYWGRNPTWLGNQVVDNYFYDIGNPYGGYGQQSVFFDDGSVGAYVARNVFYKASSGKTGVNYAVKTYGGNFNTVEKNIFVENENAMCATSWTTSDGKQTGWYNWLQDLPPRASSGIKAKMEAVQFDKPGSAFWEAYPWFRTIISDGAPANGTNQFKGNLVVKGGYNVSTPNLTLSNNYKTNDDPGFKNYGSDFALTDQGLAFVQTKIPGFQNVEFDKMGLLTNIGGTAPVVSNAKVSAPVMTRVTVKAEYDFSDADGDKESVSLFQWYVSDTVDGTYTELANRTGKSLYIEDSLKDKYIKYQVTPVDNRLTKGEAVMSQPVLVTKNTTLSEAITLAQEFMNGLTAGSDLGQVPQSAKDALQAVITKALDVGEDASDQEIEKMIGELQRAMTDAQDAIIREVTMSENNKNITLVAKLEGQVINIPEAITDATITFPSDKLAYDVMVKGQVVIDGTVRDVTITIPKGTSSPDGNFTLFHVTNPSVTVPSAERAQTILFGDATFATPVRIQINGVAKQSVGYISNGKFYAVSAKVKEDSVSGASSVKPMGIVVDETDMIVWTKQLNELVLYTKTAVTPLPSPTSTSPSTGGGGNYGGGNYVVNNGSGNPIGVGSQNDNDDQAQARFSDIVNHWARNDIEEMAAKGIVFGVDDNRFEPDRPVTRAEFAAIISRGLNISTGSGEFKDVASTDWFSQSVYAAANAGLIVGYDGYFRPDDLITREEMAVIIAKAYAYRGKTAGSGGVDKFTDKGDISQWAYGYVDAVTTEGLVFGKTVDTFVPKDIATRAETTSLIKRLLEK